ncbi:MAG: hypothetical protein ACD_45C00752G0003 [uncultured bacterium]|nr:MAG: hypothetical protein ACD_45C00752G0003 [uncultured bacterium]
MPNSLKEKYKEYQQKLTEAIKAYKKLKELEIAAKDFLDRERSLHDEKQNIQSSMLQQREEREKWRSKKLDLPGSIKQTSEIKKQEALQLELDDATKNFERVNTRIAEDTQAMQVLQPHIPWLTKDGKLEITNYVGKFVEPKKFHAYMDAMDEIQAIDEGVTKMQNEVMDLLAESKRNQEKGLEEVLAWAQKNVRPLIEEREKLHLESVNMFNCKLRDAYHRAAEEHLRYLDGKKYEEGFKSGKYHLDDLERFVAKRRKNQSDYRKALPDYVRGLIGDDVHIKGQRIMGIGKTNTGEKVSKISEFLAKPFNSAEKASDLKRLKALFEAISVHFVDTEIEQLYNAAIQQKQKLAGPEEKGAPPPKLS